MVTMNNRARLLIYGLAIIAGTFLGLLVAFNIVNNAFEEKGGNPVSLGAAVDALMAKKIQAQVDNLTASTNPCLKSVSAAPKNSGGVDYTTYNLALDRNIYSAVNLNAVKLNGVYNFTSTFSNDGSCANRPDKAITQSVKQVAYLGTYLFDAKTNQQIAKDNGKNSEDLIEVANSKIGKTVAASTAKYSKTLSAAGKKFDITQCCSRNYVAALPVPIQEVDE